MITPSTLYKVTCDRPGCTQVMGDDEAEYWTWDSLVPVADANYWLLVTTEGPGKGQAYCYDHSARDEDDD